MKSKATGYGNFGKSKLGWIVIKRLNCMAMAPVVAIKHHSPFNVSLSPILNKATGGGFRFSLVFYEPFENVSACPVAVNNWRK